MGLIAFTPGHTPDYEPPVKTTSATSVSETFEDVSDLIPTKIPEASTREAGLVGTQENPIFIEESDDTDIDADYNNTRAVDTLGSLPEIPRAKKMFSMATQNILVETNNPVPEQTEASSISSDDLCLRKSWHTSNIPAMPINDEDQIF